ncbi:hypothetical protein KAI58_04605 [Candidatus Gracilibacteria bacterium]|nr:hypothetical protein [Candidatus Gracilibacteria bacterium]
MAVEVFKQNIDKKIDQAVDQAIGSADVEKLNEFKKKADDLRLSLKEAVTLEYAEDDKITETEWKEIFDSLPKELLEEFLIKESKDLRDFILFGEKLNDSQRELFQFNVPDMLKLEDLQQVSEQLVKMCVNIHSLGGYGKDFNEKEAKEHVQLFQEKLANITIQAEVLQNTAKTELDKNLARETILIVLHLYFDLQKFIDGSFFQQLKYDLVQEEGIEEHDIKSKYIKYGIERSDVKSFIENKVSESLMFIYYKEGLLQKDFYPFVLKKVPVEVVKSFLSHFSLREKAIVGHVFKNDDVVEILCDIGDMSHLNARVSQVDFVDIDFVARYIKEDFYNSNTIDRELLGKYYPELLSSYEETDLYDSTKKEKKYFQSLNQITLAYEKMQGNSNEEKFIRYKSFRDLGLCVEEILVANAIPDLLPDNIQKQIAESEGIFTVSDIYAIHVNGLDLNELKLFYESLSAGTNKNIYEFLNLKETLSNTPMVKILPYVKFMDGRDFNIGVSISYFLENKISSETIQDYKNAGVGCLDEIASVMQSKVSLKYLQDLQAIGIQESNSDRIMDWHKAGLTAKLIKPFFELIDAGKAGYEILQSENIKRYLKVIDSKEKQEYFLLLSGASVSTEEALTAVEKNIALKDVQMVKKYELGVSWVELFKKHDLVGFVQILEAQNERNLSYSLEKIVSLLEAGINKNDVKEMLQLSFNLKFALSVHEVGENWRGYLLYKEFASYNNLQALQMMKFFQVSPKNLKRYCKQYPNGGYEVDYHLVDAVVLSEYERGNLPEKFRQFLEKHNLSFPSRYPVSILRQMQNGYESVERQGKPTALVVIGKNDWNSAFQSDSELYKTLLKVYNVYIYEVATEKDFLNTVDGFGKQGTKIDFMVIGGHGYPQGINFSSVRTDYDQAYLDTSDGDDLKNLGQYFSKDANISLMSCSTGKGGVGADNIANTISASLGGIKVFAPNKPTSIRSYVYNENGKVVGVEYSDDGVEEEISILPK